jgi:hypothetical protein
MIIACRNKRFLLFCLLVSAVICCLYAGFATRAGRLWRDEINSLEMATMPTLSDIWSAMRYDSFPIVPTLMLRLWAAIGGAMTEGALRAFGFLVGISVLGAFWCTSRLLSHRPPWLSLILIAGSPLMIRTIEWIRPYGLGVAFIVMTLGLVWMVATSRGGWPMLVAASMAATLSVQCLFSNATLVLAICLGGFAVALDRRDWRRGAAVLVVGLISAASLVPYLGHFRAAAGWVVLLRQPVPATRVAGLMANAMELSFQPGRHVWLLLLLASLLAAATVLIGGRRRGISDDRRQLALFSVTALVMSGILTLAFLRMVSILPAPWYYVPWMAVAAVLLEAIFDQAVVSARWWSISRVAAAVLLVLVAIPSWNGLSVRQTNVDRVAKRLERTVREEDRIVVFPWYIGVGFRHYYHGRAPWATLPPISDLRIHRYDLLRDEYINPQPPVKPILDDLAATLSSGGRIFVVGDLPPEGDPLHEFTRFVNDQTRSIQHVLIAAPPRESVSVYESLTLTVVKSRTTNPEPARATSGDGARASIGLPEALGIAGRN